MARDGDRHQLGDPVSRIADDPALRVPSLDDTADAHRLSEQELRRELANLSLIISEAAERGTPDTLIGRARGRVRALADEYRRRGMTAPVMEESAPRVGEPD